MFSRDSISFFEKLTGVKPRPLSLEIALINQQIRFQVACDASLVPFVETQIQSNYPLVIIQKTPDVLPPTPLEIVNLKLKQGSYYPLATFDKFKDVPRFTATETLKNLELGRDHKRRGILGVKRTDALIVTACLFQTYVGTDQVDNVYFLLDLVNRVHCSLYSIPRIKSQTKPKQAINAVRKTFTDNAVEVL